MIHKYLVQMKTYSGDWILINEFNHADQAIANAKKAQKNSPTCRFRAVKEVPAIYEELWEGENG